MKYMKTNELRIGNWFIQYDEPEQFDGDFYHLSDIKFIEITDEWLLKLGFQCIFTHDDHHYFNGFLALDRDFQVMYYEITYEIKYVHQLQNLYFALTGEELEIEL